MILDMTPHRFALCGHAFGGNVALEIMRRAPNRVSRLCLIATNPMAETPIRAAERDPQIIAARTGRLEQVISEEMVPDDMEAAVKIAQADPFSDHAKIAVSELMVMGG